MIYSKVLLERLLPIKNEHVKKILYKITTVFKTAETTHI